MKKVLAALLLAGCHDFGQGLRECYEGGACHDAGTTASAGGSTAGGSTAGGGTAGGSTAGGGAAGGSTAGGGSAGGTAGGMAGGAAGGTSPWTVRSGPGSNTYLTGIQRLDDGSLWVCNDLDTVWRFAGSWSMVAVPNLGGFLHGLTSAGNHLYTFSEGGYVEHWNGTVWEEVGPTADDWYAAKALPGGRLWLAGELDTAPKFEVARTDNFGTNYDFQGEMATGRAVGVCVVPQTNDAWFVSSLGSVLFWRGDGGMSPVVETAGQGPLKGIWCDGNDVVLVGLSGLIKERQSDGGYERVTPAGVIEDLFAIDGRSATDLWAVGAGGVIVHGGRGNWARVLSPTTRDLNAVTVFADGGAYAAGGFGTVLSLP